MSSDTIAIIAAAVAGGAAVLAIIVGLSVFMVLRRRKRRRSEELENMRLSRQMGSNVDVRQVEPYSSSQHGSSAGSSIGRKLVKSKKGKTSNSPPSQRNSQDDANSRDSPRIWTMKRKPSQQRPVSEVSIVDTAEAERAVTYQPLELYLPTGLPIDHPPLTPISERDTPDSGGVIAGRRSRTVSSRSQSRKVTEQPERASSLRWLPEVVSKPPDRPEKRTKVQDKSDEEPGQSGVPRPHSPTGRSMSLTPASTNARPPAPDAIYDACSRLSPLPGPRSSLPKHIRTGSGSDLGTRSSISSIFDGNASFTTAGSYFPSIGRSSARNSKRDTLLGNVQSEALGSRTSYRSPATSPGLLARIPTATDSVRTEAEQAVPGPQREAGKQRSSSHQHLAQSTKPKDNELHAEQYVESWHSSHPSEHHSDQHFQSWHRRRAPEGQDSTRGRQRRQALRESFDGSNRQSPNTSTSSSIEPPSKSQQGRKKKAKSEQQTRKGKSMASRSRESKRGTTQRIVLQISRPNSIATSAILEDEVFNGSPSGQPRRPGHNEMRSAKTAVPVLGQPQSEQSAVFEDSDPDAELTQTMRSIANSFSENDSDPSALWSLICGDRSDASASRRQDSIGQLASGEESEDLLKLPLEKPGTSSEELNLKSRGRSQGNFHPRPLPSPPHSLDDTYGIKPVSPLRPYNTALSVATLPPLDDSIQKTLNVSAPAPLRPRSSGNLSASRAAQPLQHTRSAHEPRHRRSHESTAHQQQRRSREERLSSEALASSSALYPPIKDLTLKSSFRLSRSPNPPNEPLPPNPPLPPPAVPTRNHARMTSIMMHLRRQNSDGSRADSTYFRLPQSQRTSRSSYGIGSSVGGNTSGSRTSRISGSQCIDGLQQPHQATHGGAISLSSIGSSTLMARRATEAMEREDGKGSDPFIDMAIAAATIASGREGENESQVQSDPTEIRPRSSRQLPLDSAYLQFEPPASPTTYEPFKPSRPRSQGRPSTSGSTNFVFGQGLVVQRGRETEKERQRKRSQQPGQQKRAQAAERDGSPDDRHRSLLGEDDSERDLSPIGKRIMAEKRREHFDRQRAPISVGGEGQKPSMAVSLPSRQEQYGLVALGHGRSKSNVNSVGSGSDVSRPQSNHARRESQLQKVVELRERVASMEYLRKSGP